MALELNVNKETMAVTITHLVEPQAGKVGCKVAQPACQTLC
jgi:hypothetical protein